MTADERFWVKVLERDDGCWIWQGYTMPNGYGQFRDGRTVTAHRWAFEAVVGVVPAGLEIHHRCGVRNCVNPAHMEPIGRREHMRLTITWNAQKTHCNRGHPLSGPNLHVERSGARRCRACQRAAGRRYKAKCARRG